MLVVFGTWANHFPHSCAYNEYCHPGALRLITQSTAGRISSTLNSWEIELVEHRDGKRPLRGALALLTGKATSMRDLDDGRHEASAPAWKTAAKADGATDTAVAMPKAAT
jgi:hypothetical protein